jgi:2,4-dienoyl-CoA reductase-like NADH-dependent reductase (Old Yellow Enzyme family)
MTIHEIEDLVKRSAYAAKVLYDAGADGVQYHAAHGYLLSQFLSPNVNLRTDKYGGSMENRSRLVFEIIAAIRKEVPDPRFLMSMKVSGSAGLQALTVDQLGRLHTGRILGRGLSGAYSEIGSGRTRLHRALWGYLRIQSVKLPYDARGD